MVKPAASEAVYAEISGNPESSGSFLLTFKVADKPTCAHNNAGKGTYTLKYVTPKSMPQPTAIDDFGHRKATKAWLKTIFFIFHIHFSGGHCP